MADEVGGIVGKIEVDDRDVAPGLARAGDQFSAFARHLDGARAATERLDRATAAAARSRQSFARGMLDLSRGVEDFATGGPLGVLNNIPGIFTNMASAAGVSAVAVAGWTTGITLAATGAYVLYQHWDDLSGLFGEHGPLTAAEEMERLEKTTHRTADQQERLNKLKREEKQVEAQTNRRPGEERETGSAVGKVIGEADAETLRAAIRERLRAGIEVTDAEVEKVAGPERAAALRASRGAVGLAPGRLEEIRQDLIDRKNRAAAADATDLLRAAEFGVGKEGRDARERLAKMVADDPDAFPPGFGRALGATTPEARARKAGQEAIFEGRQAEAEDDRKAQDARAKRWQEDMEREGKVREEADKDRAVERGKMMAEVMVADDMADFDASDLAKAKSPKQVAAGMRANVRNFLRADAEESRVQDRIRRLGRRLGDIMAPEIRASQVFNSADLNRSVQSSVTNGPSEEARRLAEVRDEIRQFRDDMKQLGQPVQRGGK